MTASIEELRTRLRAMQANDSAADEPPPIGDEDLTTHAVAADEADTTASAIREVRPRRAPELVDTILDRADEPFTPLRLGADEIARCRPGGTVVVMGPSGGGKSSFVAGLMESHAREQGPALFLSCELPSDEAGARIVGMLTDSSWEDVLLGRVPRHEMERVLDLPRLAFLDRRSATLNALGKALAAEREAHPDAPILVAVDYAQIVPSAQADMRIRVNDIMASLDDIAREHRAVIIVVSQMSRASSRSARAGETLGAATTDGGAESAAIERYASVTLTIGKASEPAEDGSQVVLLSIGKYRMGQGDRVIPMRYEGRSGRWRVDGAARSAAEVRAEAQAEREDSRTNAAALAMVAYAAKSTEPVTRSDLRAAASVSHAVAAAAVRSLLDAGELVEVRQRRPRSSSWLIWSRDRAEAADLPIIGGNQ